MKWIVFLLRALKCYQSLLRLSSCQMCLATIRVFARSKLRPSSYNGNDQAFLLDHLTLLVSGGLILELTMTTATSCFVDPRLSLRYITAIVYGCVSFIAGQCTSAVSHYGTNIGRTASPCVIQVLVSSRYAVHMVADLLASPLFGPPLPLFLLDIILNRARHRHEEPSRAEAHEPKTSM